MKTKRWNWVPNALTLGNLTLGFVSVGIASEPSPNHFAIAGFLIILAAWLDGLDGVAARALNATSEIGADLDSLADLTTFGIAPGFLTYKILLVDYKLDLFGKEDLFPLGMLVAAIFPICAAYRLARFNVAHDPKFFVGLPSPVAGVTIGFFPLVVSDFNLVPNWISIPLFIAVALLMVSTIRYSKPQVAMKEKITKSKMILMVLFLFLMLPILGWSKWVWFCYGIVLFYIFAGLIAFVIQTIQEFGD